MSTGDGPLTLLLSVARAAEVLDCSRAHIYGLIAAGELSAVEIKATGARSKTRILAGELEAFIERRTRRADPRGGAGLV